MTPRVKFVISALYRQGAARQVFAVSRAEAERLPPLSTVAIISITAPERPLAKLEGFEYLLRLNFADVDHLNQDLSARAREKLHSAFTIEQANAIFQFVEAIPPDIRTIVVHCEGGYSRSCAVACALHELYGYTVEHEQLKAANQSVIQMLRKAAAQQKTERE